MIRLFDPYQERVTGRNYLPADDVVVNGSGGTETLELSGRHSEEYGILALTTDQEQPEQRVTVALQDGDRPLIEGVLSDAISRLFAQRAYDLAAPLVIPSGESLHVTFENPTPPDSHNSVFLHGLPKTLLEQRRRSIREAGGGGRVPEVSFAYRTFDVANGQTVRQTLNLPKGEWATDHIEVVATDGGVTVEVEETNTRLIESISAGALQRYSEHRLSLPTSIAVGGRDNIAVTATNNTGSTQTVSALMPLYQRLGTLTGLTRP
jgi:hypothetical protein